MKFSISAHLSVLLVIVLFTQQVQNMTLESPNSFNVPHVPEESIRAYEKLRNENQYDKIVYYFDLKGQVAVEEVDNGSWEQFTNFLVQDKSRYIVTKLYLGNDKHKMVFIQWVPFQADLYMNSNYILSKDILLNRLEGIDEVIMSATLYDLMTQIRNLRN